MGHDKHTSFPIISENSKESAMTFEEDLARRLSELESLNSLSRTVARSISLDEVINATLDQVMEILLPDMAILFLEDQGYLKVTAYRSRNQQFCRCGGTDHSIGECLCGLAALEDRILSSSDIHHDARCTRNECKNAGLSSCLSVPLKTREGIVGVLGLGTIRRCEFTDRTDFLSSVASIVSTGIANSRLHAKVVAHARDLEDLVRQKTEDLRLFFNAVEHSPASIVITDDKGTIEYVNPYFTRLTGYTAEQAMGQNPRILKSELHDQKFYAEMWSTLLSGQSWRGELCNRKADGSLYWEDASISPLKDEKGRIAKFVAVKEDITERKKFLSALQESENKYRTVVDSSQDAILVADEKTREVVFANKAASRLFGYNAEEFKKLMVDDLHPPDSLSMVLDAFRLQSLGSLNAVEDLPCSHKNTNVFFADVRATSVDFDGRLCVMGFFRDTTVRRQAAQLREDIDRILRHDLKTPLNGIINLPEIILQEKGLSPTQEEYLKILSRTGRSMLDMINHSLDMYRMEAGTYEYRPESMHLVRCIQDLLQNTLKQATKKKIVLDVTINGRDLNESGEVYVQTERILFRSIFTNLILNALEAAPEKSPVQVTINTKHGLHMVIHNQGAVPEQIRSKFFEKYTTYGKPRGVGLGTYSARLSARVMGGDISMQTSEKLGTTLTVTLP